MNQFKMLDTLFPCGTERLCGEVVGITVNFTALNSKRVFFGKRKAWYVNASVNAFHLHRQLCKELRDSVEVLGVKQSDVRVLKQVLAQITLFSYRRNATWDEQYHEFEIVETVKGHYAIAYIISSEEKMFYNHVSRSWGPGWELIPYSFILDALEGVEKQSAKAIGEEIRRRLDQV